MAAKPKKINLKPSPGVVIIDPQEATTKTESGIYLPDSSDEKPQKGVVLAVGDDEVTDSGATKSAPTKPGDEVIYKKWGGNEVKVGEREYLFAKFDDILAIVK